MLTAREVRPTTEQVRRAYIDTHRPREECQRVERAALRITSNSAEARELTKAVFKALTIGVNSRPAYVRAVREWLGAESTAWRFVEQQMSEHDRPPDDTITAAYTLVEETASQLDQMGRERQARKPVAEDVGASRRRLSMTIAATMMYQSLMDPREREEYIEILCGIIPRRTATMTRTIQNAIATDLMGNWLKRPLSDLEVVNTTLQAETRQQGEAALLRLTRGPTSDREAEGSMIDQILITRGNRIMEGSAPDMETTDRRIMRLWMETWANRPSE